MTKPQRHHIRMNQLLGSQIHIIKFAKKIPSHDSWTPSRGYADRTGTEVPISATRALLHFCFETPPNRDARRFTSQTPRPCDRNSNRDAQSLDEESAKRIRNCGCRGTDFSLWP